MKNLVLCPVIALLLLLVGENTVRCDIIRVDSIIVAAKSYEAAEALGKEQALKKALQMMGDSEISSILRNEIMGQTNSLVTIRQALNTKKRNGVYTPVFFCNIDRTKIETIIEDYRTPTLTTLHRPRINIAIVFRSLPVQFEANKTFFLDRVNNLLEEHFGKAGFRIGTPPSEMVHRLDRKDPRKVFEAFVRYSTEVNYLLFGAMDLLKEDVTSKDGGRYFQSRIGLTLRFFSISSHDQVSFSRDVYGMGDNQKASVVNAMRNCAKAVTEKIGAHRVVADWDKKIAEGFEYSLMFCSFNGSRWIKPLRRALKRHGHFISKSRGDNATLIYRYHAHPGAFVFPSIDFEKFLDDLEGFDTVESGVILVKDRLFYVFGDDFQCFDMGYDASENTLNIGNSAH